MVRLVAQLVKGVTMEVQLALELLEINAVLRFGAFAYVPAGDVILFCHTMADRELPTRKSSWAPSATSPSSPTNTTTASPPATAARPCKSCWKRCVVDTSAASTDPPLMKD